MERTQHAHRYIVLDDDPQFRASLVRSLERRGEGAVGAATVSEAVVLAQAGTFSRAVIDLRIQSESGLDALAELRSVAPTLEMVVLTGYGSIATTQEAIRRGADSYLTKPATTERIIQSFSPGAQGPVTTEVPTLDEVEWEHLQRVFEDCKGNISLTARVLGLHRRSLQRKLQKAPVHRE